MQWRIQGGQDVPIRQNGLLLVVLSLYAVLWMVLAWEPYNRFDWLLENLLIFAAVIVLAVTYRRFVFSNLSYMLLFVFLLLHTVGAHYSYNTNLLDVWLKRLFHFPRNEYDRVVHFSFGLLLAYPLREWTIRALHWTKRESTLLVPVLILAAGAFYELIEMWVAQIVAPEIGVMFLGTQGDPWDTQHDMELALYGAVLTMLLTVLLGRRAKRKSV